MSWARLGASFSIPASAEEQHRRDVERELDMHFDAPERVRTSSFLDENSLRHSTTRKAYAHRLARARRASDSEASETSDEDQIPHLLSQSTGNHTVFLATPRDKGRRLNHHVRPRLSREAKEHLDISRIARVEDASDDDAPAKPPAQPRTYTRRPSPQGSRHSSAETKVNEETPAHLPEHVRWAEHQLEALVSCIRNMEREVSEIRSGTPLAKTGLEALMQRTSALEAEVDAHKQELAHLAASFHVHEAQCAPEPMDRLARQLASALQGASRSDPPRSDPPRSDPPVRSPRPLPTTEMGPEMASNIARLYEELARISQTLEQLQGHVPASRRGAPLTPPYEKPSHAPWQADPARFEPSRAAPARADDANWRAAEIPHVPDPGRNGIHTAQERYEQVCRAVAEAMGLPNSPDPHLRRSRKDRIRAGLRTREAADITSEVLLRRLQESPAPFLSDAELRVLEQVFELHRREFLHQERLYSELADELKRMDPTMDRMKRRILAEHLHESIDSLEAEATRLNDLHAHLARHGRVARYDVHAT